MSLKLTIKVVAFFLGHPVYFGSSHNAQRHYLQGTTPNKIFVFTWHNYLDDNTLVICPEQPLCI